jgi:hypothetical protein
MDNTGSSIYFTIHTQHQGFTDQLMQFNAFYKLGLALGYRYVFTPFNSRRSLPTGTALTTIAGSGSGAGQALDKAGSGPDDIYDFLGFNQHFGSGEYCLPGEAARTVEVELSDAILAENAIASFDDLKQHVNKCVNDAACDRQPAAVRQTDDLLVVLRLDRRPPPAGKGKRQFFSLIHKEVPDFQDGLDLRALYFDARKADPEPSLFSGDGLRVLLHIRQGDTGVVETPWGTFLPVDSRRPDFLVEHRSYDAISSTFSNNALDSIFDPVDYCNFLRNLLSRLHGTSCSILGFSDGYQRAFNIIRHHADRLAVTPEQWGALMHARDSYDSRKFRVFKEIENCRCIVGETWKACGSSSTRR